MIRKVNKAIWILIPMLLVFGLTNVVLAGQGSKNPPTSDQHYQGPAMVGTISVTYINPSAYTALFVISMNIQGTEKTATGMVSLDPFTEEDFRNAGGELFNDFTLPATIAQQLDCYDQLNISTIMKFSQQETELGPSIQASVVLLRVVAKK